VVQTQADQAKLSLRLAADEPTRAALQKQIGDWQKTADTYRSDPSSGEGQDQLAARAKKIEQARDLAMAKYHHFELASAAFQIAIVLASAAIITGTSVLTWISGLLALVGVGITAAGIFAPHALHMLAH
jgi:hypothetical protein